MLFLQIATLSFGDHQLLAVRSHLALLFEPFSIFERPKNLWSSRGQLSLQAKLVHGYSQYMAEGAVDSL